MMTRTLMAFALTILVLPSTVVWSQAEHDEGRVDRADEASSQRLYEYVPEEAIGVIVLQTLASIDKSLAEATQVLPEGDPDRLTEADHPSLSLLGDAFLANPNAVDPDAAVIMVLLPSKQEHGQERPLLPYHMMLIAKPAPGVTKAPAAGQPDRLIMPMPTVHLVDGVILVTNSSEAPTKPAKPSKLTELLPSGEIRLALDFAELWAQYSELFSMSAMRLLADDPVGDPNYVSMAVMRSISDHAKNITNIGCGLQIGATTDITVNVWTDVRASEEGPDRKLAMMASRLRHGTVMASIDQKLVEWANDMMMVAAQHAEKANATPQAKADLVRLGKLVKTLAAEGQTGRVMSVELYENAMGIQGLAGTSDPEKYLGQLREVFGLMAELPGMDMNMNMKIEPGDMVQMQLKPAPDMQPAMVQWLNKYGMLKGKMSVSGDDMVSIQMASGELPQVQITQLNHLADLIGQAQAEVRMAWAVNVGQLVGWAFSVLDSNVGQQLPAGQNAWMLGTLERHPLMWQMEMRIPVSHILEAALMASANRAQARPSAPAQ